MYSRAYNLAQPKKTFSEIECYFHILRELILGAYLNTVTDDRQTYIISICLPAVVIQCNLTMVIGPSL